MALNRLPARLTSRRHWLCLVPHITALCRALDRELKQSEDWGWKMAQSIKSWLCKHEGPEFVPFVSKVS